MWPLPRDLWGTPSSLHLINLILCSARGPARFTRLKISSVSAPGGSQSLANPVPKQFTTRPQGTAGFCPPGDHYEGVSVLRARPQSSSLKAEENVKRRGEGAGGQHPHSKACLLRPWGQEGGLSDLQQVEGEQTRKPAASNPLPTKPRAAVHCPPGRESRVHTPPAAHHREPFPSGGWGSCPPPLLNGISCAQCGPGSKSAADLTRVRTGAGRPAGPLGQQRRPQPA